MKTILVLLFSIVVTDQAGQYTREGVAYDSRDACVASAENGLGPDEQVCEQVNTVTIKGSCADVPAPVLTKTTQTSDFCPGSDTIYWFAETKVTPAPYPQCWAIEQQPTSAPADYCAKMHAREFKDMGPRPPPPAPVDPGGLQ